jgi:SAM-dependent methyltransferase
MMTQTISPTPQPTAEDLAAFVARQREVWDAGDYDAVVARLLPAGERLVDRLEVRAGDRVLDVACGTGNATLPAGRRGARVTGLDLAPGLLRVAEAKARTEGLDIEWVEGDVMSLPFPEASFDVVLSTFGCMFAPDHERTASELVRVLRSGGRLGVAAWSPTGAIGAMFRTVGRHMPPPPPWAGPPATWGDPAHARELFAPLGVDVDLAVETISFRFESSEAEMTRFSGKFGPLVMARALLEPQGRWEALLRDLIALYDELGSQHADGFGYDAEYLVITGRKP